MRETTKIIDFAVFTPTGYVNLKVPVRWDLEVEQWILTPEAHHAIDTLKTKCGLPDPDPITREALETYPDLFEIALHLTTGLSSKNSPTLYPKLLRSSSSSHFLVKDRNAL